ncbi:MAG: hypothetical protein ABJA71_07990 [Ginsengibacter sp.]
MAEFKGKKIAIASLSPASLQQESTHTYWNSFKSGNPNTVLILIPANDFNSVAYPVKMENIKNNLSENIVLSVGVLVKKNNGSSQDAVMQWLTNSEKNFHFNEDVETDVQLYLISESGVLYSVLNKGVPGQVLDDVLNQTEVKEQNIVPTDTEQ